MVLTSKDDQNKAENVDAPLVTCEAVIAESS
jgi:hypothetical protein